MTLPAPVSLNETDIASVLAECRRAAPEITFKTIASDTDAAVILECEFPRQTVSLKDLFEARDNVFGVLSKPLSDIGFTLSRHSHRYYPAHELADSRNGHPLGHFAVYRKGRAPERKAASNFFAHRAASIVSRGAAPQQA